MVVLWPVEHASHARDLHGFESRVKRASQFIKSQTAVSTTERYFTLSVVCLIVEVLEDSVRVTKKNQIVVIRLDWNGSKGLSYNYNFLNKQTKRSRTIAIRL